MSQARIYLSKWSASSDTRRTMKQALDRVAGVLRGLEDKADCEDYPWHELRYEDVRALIGALQDYRKPDGQPLQPSTINKMLAAVRGVLETCWRAGAMPDDVYRKIKIANVSGNTERAGRILAPEEMDALAAACRDGEPQDCALVGALAGAGLRRVELVRLRAADFRQGPPRLTATGKGQKRREIPLGERWAAPFERWWSRHEAREMLFDFDRRRVSYVVEKFNQHCKSKQPFTPHDLRRTFGTHVYKVGGIALAQKLLGHSNIATTALYLRIDVAAEAAAVSGL